ncbi:MAG: Ig-like domain-containing protein, partial [Pseudomonadota bacterium]|nr:Ig-like domain-containing protein [Pseudomonadota bacterium]
ANVIITTIPAVGTLTLNGVAVTAGQSIAVADINSNLLVFTPVSNASGASYDSFTFQVQDDGGTANGGVDTDQAANTMTIDVTPVNDEPAGADNTLTTLEDTGYTFAASDFGFTDAIDGDSLQGVLITTLPALGSLTLNGVAVTAGQTISVADINSNLLVFTPATNGNGTGYTSFTFQVQDDGGTANGGVDTDQSANTITFDVTPVNDAPDGANNTVTTLEDTAYTFATTDFGFTDAVEGDSLLAVTITTIPTNGSLTLNGVAVTAGQSIAVADIVANLLVFTPAANANGASYDSFTFQVQDDGGTANGGLDLDPTANTMTIDVTSVNDAPEGADVTLTAVEDTPLNLAASVGAVFSDPNDSPANGVSGVRITTLPAAGSLYLAAGASAPGPVSAGQIVSAADAVYLTFLADTNDNGAGYTSFTYQLIDDGGTANGGVNEDQTPNTVTIDVTPVNDEPAGADNTVTTLEDTGYTFAAADFGFSDAVEGDSLLAVTITTLPSNGSLTLNGVAVTAGQSIAVADINSNLLVFTPAANANGASYDSFTFQVQDDGGTANGGVDLDQSANTMTIDVTPVNDEPAGADNTVTTLEDVGYTFSTTDFGFTDAIDGDSLQAVVITTIPTNGTLTLNGVAVTAGQTIAVADITSNLLVFTPASNASGAGHDSFTFQVQDDGGTADGGVDTDQSANTMTIDVTPINDAPEGAD